MSSILNKCNICYSVIDYACLSFAENGHSVLISRLGHYRLLDLMVKQTGLWSVCVNQFI